MRHPVRAPRLLRGLAAAVLVPLLAVAACGAEPAAEPDAAPPAGAIPELHAALPDEIKQAGVLRFAGDSHPPYRTVNPDGSVSGVDADFQAALGRVLGVRTETLIVDGLPAALQGMLAGRYDAFNGPVKATAEREQQFDTVTWMTTRSSYVIPAGSSAGIAASDDLCGKRVAVTAGSITEEQLAKLSEYCGRIGRPAVETIALTDTNETLLAAESGRADAAGMTQAAAIDVTSQQPDRFTYVTQTEEQGATTDNLALFVPKDSGLGPVMLDAFRALFADGTYAEIMQKWGLTDVTVPEPILNAGTAEGAQ
ncbi:MAG TPA: transporter substrate-binding domain-containing protein [Pseudonocardia sp.]|jgi:polar amino acid transport system substrate-binding protein|uniref:transporter substrate-binding domain-containing protein n=1 Tax=Pseudonocardia sp. TaxID=60912 RepID=UPI002B4B842C|nr:transporter substrate-binding domain-containing protein [Pseudonocardia sp.]HLU56339.1 transporter substrate-binding domain-containing protein [Pseudonocardia sp.]